VALIQTPGPGRKLQRGLRLTALPDSILGPELVGVIIVEDFSAPLSDISRGCVGSEGVAGAAAEFPVISMVRVGNPAPYEQVITAVHFSSAADQIIRILRPSAAVLGIVISSDTGFTDFNLPGRPTSQLGSFSAVAIPAGQILFSLEILAGVFYRIPVDIRMGTVAGFGNALLIVGLTPQTVIRGGFEWTESDLLG